MGKGIWEKSTLERITKESETVKEVLIKLGLVPSGHNNKTFKKYRDLYSIDTKHFKKNYHAIANLSRNKKINTSDILIENSTYNRGWLKKRLYDEGLKERICEICGQDENWNGKKMGLILDHINGKHNDNRIENLRIVCPNCNATLPTHCGRNRAKKKIKISSYPLLKKELEISTKFEIFKKYGETYNNKRMVEDIEKLSELKKSDIDFTKFGWVTKASKIIGVKDQVVNRWLKRVDPEFYKSCFVKNDSKNSIK